MKRIIPDGAQEQVLENLKAVIYRYDNGDGQPVAKVFTGRKSKPEFCYRFASPEHREKCLDQWLKERNERIARDNEHKNFSTTLNVDDILVSSWGYDQTNIDFYQVVAVSPTRRSINIRPIAREIIEYSGQAMSGKVIPLRNDFTGNASAHRVTPGNRIRLSSFSGARPWEGKPEVYTTYA